MRIVGGWARGRRLAAPPGRATRPTSDRVREAIFNILGPPPAGARVLDLFAGAGALALEALSRGAGAAVLVDNARPACRAIHKNIAPPEVADRAEVRCADAGRALRRLEAEARSPGWPGGFGWVFLDPPYRGPALADALRALGGGALLAPDAIVLAEHPARAEPDPAPGLLVKADCRRYGDTAVTLYRPRRA